MSTIALIDKLCVHEHPYSCQGGYYGDVEHCLKDVKRRYPQAFVEEYWVRDNRMNEHLRPEMQELFGETQEWCLIWGGRYQTAVAFMVRSYAPKRQSPADFTIPADWECPSCWYHDCPGCQPHPQGLSCFV